MMLIAEIMVMTDRADMLVRKVYREEAKTFNAKQIFSRKLDDINKGLIQPYFEEYGVYLYYIQRGGLYFVASSKIETSHIAIIEFLSRLYHMARDLCGTVSETSVRLNQVPLFEMLHEAMDGGCVQIFSTEKLRPFIHSTPVTVQSSPSTPEELASRMFGIERTSPIAQSSRTAVRCTGNQKGLFIDVVENLTAVTNSEGEVVHVAVSGSVNISNLLQAHPTLTVALNPDLHVCRQGEVKAFGRSAQLDACTLHQAVNAGEFHKARVLKMVAPDAKFSAMTYKVEKSSVSLPVRILLSFPEIENSKDTVVRIRVSLTIPSASRLVKLHMSLPLPSSVTSVSQGVKGPSESLKFVKDRRQVTWVIRNMCNAEESTAQLRLISQTGGKILSSDIGPLMAEFEVSSMTLSGLNVRSLKIMEGSQPSGAKRFVRYVTLSDSFTVKT